MCVHYTHTYICIYMCMCIYIYIYVSIIQWKINNIYIYTYNYVYILCLNSTHYGSKSLETQYPGENEKMFIPKICIIGHRFRPPYISFGFSCCAFPHPRGQSRFRFIRPKRSRLPKLLIPKTPGRPIKQPRFNRQTSGNHWQTKGIVHHYTPITLNY